MTAEMYDYISREFTEAEKAGDEERMSRIMVRAILAMLDCQRKTSDRVKELCARDKEAKELVESQREIAARVDELCHARDMAKAKLTGAKLAWDALKLISAAGGGALILKLLAVAGAA